MDFALQQLVSNTGPAYQVIGKAMVQIVCHHSKQGYYSRLVGSGITAFKGIKRSTASPNGPEDTKPPTITLGACRSMQIE